FFLLFHTQRSPFWGSGLAIPLPGTGPLRCRPSPSPHSPSPTCADASSSLPEGWATTSHLSPVSPASLLASGFQSGPIQWSSAQSSTSAAAPAELFPSAAAMAEPSSLAAAPAEPSTSTAVSAGPPTPFTEVNQGFVSVTYSPYLLEFMARVLGRGKFLTDLAIHLLSSRGSLELTLEVLSQLKDWKAEWGRYSPSSLTVEIIEAERQRIINGTTVVGWSEASDLSSSSPDPACTERTTDAPALIFAGGQSSPSAPVLEPQHAAKPPEPQHAAKPQEF
ncbi:hypothetical protein ATANTOWER_003413, partial [Ataeniobius toweri]|nr:hypothetical protein [Ataeniobius toweri]